MSGKGVKRRWLRGRDRRRLRLAYAGLGLLRAMTEPVGEPFMRTVVGPDGQEYTFAFQRVGGFGALGVTDAKAIRDAIDGHLLHGLEDRL